jgi:hypothetical protein
VSAIRILSAQRAFFVAARPLKLIVRGASLMRPRAFQVLLAFLLFLPLGAAAEQPDRAKGISVHMLPKRVADLGGQKWGFVVSFADYPGMAWPGMSQYTATAFELIPNATQVHDQLLRAQRDAA